MYHNRATIFMTTAVVVAMQKTSGTVVSKPHERGAFCFYGFFDGKTDIKSLRLVRLFCFICTV